MIDRLLPPDIRSQIPKLYGQEESKDPTVYAKLYTPASSLTFFITEFDGEDIAFGYTINDGEGELGYISIRELEEVTHNIPIIELDTRGQRIGSSNEMIYAVVRDEHFVPCLLSEAKAKQAEIEGR